MIARSLVIFVVLIVCSRGSNEFTENSREQGVKIFLISYSPQENILRTSNLSNVDIYDHSRLERQKIFERHLLESQQKMKREELMHFLSNNYLSTNYFYNEMKRILRTRVLKDPLRLMVEYLDKPENSKVKFKTLRCYQTLRAQKKPITDVYAHKLNNLVINVMKDPFNDGVH